MEAICVASRYRLVLALETRLSSTMREPTVEISVKPAMARMT